MSLRKSGFWGHAAEAIKTTFSFLPCHAAHWHNSLCFEQAVREGKNGEKLVIPIFSSHLLTYWQTPFLKSWEYCTVEVAKEKHRRPNFILQFLNIKGWWWPKSRYSGGLQQFISKSRHFVNWMYRVILILDRHCDDMLRSVTVFY